MRNNHQVGYLNHRKYFKMQQNMLRHAHDFNKNPTVNFVENTSETTPKTLPNDFQNAHFWHPEPPLGTLWEPRVDFLLKIVILGCPQGDPLGALGHQEGQKVHENTQRVTSKNYLFSIGNGKRVQI